MDSNSKKIFDKILDMLEHKPKLFTSRWEYPLVLNSTIRDKNKNILIDIKTGTILFPTRIVPIDDDMKTILSLLKPIIDKDVEFVINNLN